MYVYTYKYIYIYFWINQTFHLLWHDYMYLPSYAALTHGEMQNEKCGEFSPAEGWQYDYLSCTFWNLDPKSRLNLRIVRSVLICPEAATDALSEKSLIFIAHLALNGA